ncbi:MAG TPA: dipicolinate synthase subunit DpsA, partial [Solirubrobacter sp.]|nr:dipicolinate synthase subunit DpsA [Solirubrobacter sp.]
MSHRILGAFRARIRKRRWLQSGSDIIISCPTTMATALDWAALEIAVVGGDEREREIARLAATTRARVRAYGFPWPDDGIAGVQRADSAAAALDGARVALFPIPGLASDGRLFAPACDEAIVPDRSLLSRMAPEAHIILGTPDARLEQTAKELGVTLHEYESDRE